MVQWAGHAWCVTLAIVEGEKPADGLEGWSATTAGMVYTNSMGIAAGPFDVTLVFGHQDNTTRSEDNPAPASDEVVRVAMS